VSRGTVPDGRFAAVDLGASSGRVVVGEIGPHRVELTEVHRFANRPVQLPTGLHWDVLGLHGELLDGLAAAARGGALDSIGVDSWAVDYGLLDRTGALLGNPYHYRDPRTDGVADQVHNQRPFAQLYLENGLQFLPFTTLYQLVAAAGTPQLELARTLLLVPDLVVHWLTGTVATEVTNASTTGLLDVRTHTWSAALCELAGVRPPLMAPLVAPGDPLGRLLPAVTTATGLDPATPVTAVGSHDTASAVVACRWRTRTPPTSAWGPGVWSASSWAAPVLTEAGRRAGFTNELGVDGRTRYLRNVMGLWLLQECVRVWRAAGRPSDLPVLLEQAAALPPGGPLVDVADPRFLPPGDMPSRIAACCRRRAGRRCRTRCTSCAASSTASRRRWPPLCATLRGWPVAGWTWSMSSAVGR
jgi:rhamnulokinase